MVPEAGHGMHRDNAAYYDQAVLQLPSSDGKPLSQSV